MKIEDELPAMSIDTFLSVTKHGIALSILDGYVIDISTFVDVHPGGSNVLRFAVGSDITAYFTGEADVAGSRHVHGPSAIRALRPLVKYKLEEDKQGRVSERPSASARPVRRNTFLGDTFRNATVVHHTILSPKEGTDQKCIIHLGLSMKRDEVMGILLGGALPTTTFIFRSVDDQGRAFERPYTTTKATLRRPLQNKSGTLKLLRNQSDLAIEAENIVYEFFITIVPG